MKIYTKTGDEGETSLLDGTRVSKAHPRVAAYGEVDELQAVLGTVRACGLDADLDGVCVALQRDLFAIGSRLADPAGRVAMRVEKVTVDHASVERIEGWVDRFEAELPPLGHFVMAGGSPGGAALHLARTVCRRAERVVLALPREAVEPVVRVYLNRLSDLLFVMARVANHRAGVPDTEW